MKVLLSGYYGFGNVGDEAVLQAILQGLRSRNRDIEITVLSAYPNLTREINQIDSIYRYDWPKIFSQMKDTDIFISGGGTLFQNVTSNRSFLYYIGLALLPKFLRKKVMIFAQGFGPLKGGFYRGLARFVLNRVDLVTLRDKESFNRIKELGVKNQKIHVTADPTAILDPPSPEEGKKILNLEGITRTDRPLLGIAVRSVPKKKETNIYETLASGIDWLSKTYNYSPVFILFQSAEDMNETSKVIGFMKENSNIIFRICRPREMLSLISQFDLLIGMRLHSLIFAAMNKVPMLGISYDPKVEAFMKEIEQPYLKIDGNLDFQSLKEALEKILRNKEKIKIDLEAKRKRIRDQANLNFELFLASLRLSGK
jgi:polysaccharide pyruvyl transferase CsaB